MIISETEFEGEKYLFVVVFDKHKNVDQYRFIDEDIELTFGNPNKPETIYKQMRSDCDLRKEMNCHELDPIRDMFRGAKCDVCDEDDCISQCVEHIKPRKLGGSLLKMTNLQGASHKCNTIKGTEDKAKWTRLNSYLSKLTYLHIQANKDDSKGS